MSYQLLPPLYYWQMQAIDYFRLFPERLVTVS